MEEITDCVGSGTPSPSEDLHPRLNTLRVIPVRHDFSPAARSREPVPANSSEHLYCGNSRGANESTYHQIQRPPGSIERISGYPIRWKCFLACLFLDESQQPTCPQERHIRKWSQLSPTLMQSSQTCSSVLVILISVKCVHAAFDITAPRP